MLVNGESSWRAGVCEARKLRRVAVTEEPYEGREPLADCVRPPRGPAVRSPGEHVCLRLQPPVELACKLVAVGSMRSKHFDGGRVQRQQAFAVAALGGLPGVLLRQALGRDDAAVLGDGYRHRLQVEVLPPERA